MWPYVSRRLAVYYYPTPEGPLTRAHATTLPPVVMIDDSVGIPLCPALIVELRDAAATNITRPSQRAEADREIAQIELLIANRTTDELAAIAVAYTDPCSADRRAAVIRLQTELKLLAKITGSAITPKPATESAPTPTTDEPWRRGWHATRSEIPE